MMRWVVVAVGCGLASCYSPSLDPCRVTCEDSNHCPGAQLCREDGFCHQPGDEQLCNPDAEPVEIDAEPISVDAEPAPDAELPTAFRMVSAGGHQVCAIDASGALWCWGSNRNGQLGLGNSGVTRQPSPVQIGTDLTWTAISAGDDHTCGINAGALYCWGANGYGQALDVDHGSGDVFAVEEADTGPSTGWLAVAAGGRFTCALHDEGGGAREIYCAGADYTGQRGDGAANNPGPTLSAISAPAGGPVTDWQTVTAGVDHACALRADGAAYCWGLNTQGQLGDGSQMDRDVPVAVLPSVEDGAVGFAEIAAGNVATCAIAGPGANAGALYCWGSNGYGQLGVTALGTETAPRRSGVETDWSSVDASYIGMCASRADGPWCWGDGSAGLLGQGAWEYAAVPRKVIGLDARAMVSSGYQVGCAAPPAGGVVCWGQNVEGELGIGETSTKHAPAAVGASDGQWTAVAAGYWHTCAVHAGEVQCWGWNVDRAVLGVANPDTVAVPTTVTGLPAGTVTDLSVSRFVSCAIIDEGGGEVHPWCWGYNSTGELGFGGVGAYRMPTELATTAIWTGLAQTEAASCALVGTERRCWGDASLYGLGNGSTTDPLTPTAADAHDWQEVSLGAGFGCGIRDATKNLWCWGTDQLGVQGDGAGTTDAMTPHQVGTGAFAHVAAAWFGDHVCAIEETTGDLYCWGANAYGQCGVTANTAREAQVLVDAGAWTAVSTGALQTCGIKDGGSAGELWCWGAHSYHQLGIDIVQSYFEAPERIGSDAGWTAVTVGFAHGCGLRAGNLYCWGRNIHGEIGDGTAAHNVPVAVVFP